MVIMSCNADGYDPLDPTGNITIKWDVIQSDPDHKVSFFLTIKIQIIL